MKIKTTFFCIILTMCFMLSCKKEQEATLEQEVPTNTPKVDDELKGKTIEELSILRNEIFARKGYVFKDEFLNTYFSTKEWYTPNKDAQIELSDSEKERIAFIKKAEALLKPFELPKGYTKITDSSISKDIDNDGITDVIQVAKSKDNATRVLFIYLSTTKNIQKTYIADDEYDQTIPYLEYQENKLIYGINYAGSGHYTREFELKYNTEIKSFQLIKYTFSHRIMFGHIEKEYNVITGNYTVTEVAARIYDTEKMITVVNKGKQESKIIIPGLIDEELYAYLDQIGQQFEEDPYEDMAEKEDCREKLVQNLKREFEYGKLSYLGRDKIYIKDLKDFMESVDFEELIDSPNNTYSKSYYLHRDWNLDYIEKDECEDAIYLTIDNDNRTATILINNCAFVIEDGEVIHSSEQSTMLEYKIGVNCTYTFDRVTGAG